MNHSTDTVTISSQGRELVHEDHLKPVRNKIIALEAENGGLRESLEHHIAQASRARASNKAFASALGSAGKRDQALAEHLAEIIQAAYNHNSGAVISQATAALRVLA